MLTETLIPEAMSRVQQIIVRSNSDSRDVIARYTAAIAVNFTDWIGKTIPWVRHERAFFALVDNLRCEAVEDHIGMLQRFAASSDAFPEPDDYAHVYSEVETIRKLFREPATAGISGVALCAVLENTSKVFIHDLARRARYDRACTEFTYTNVHGEADAAHGDAFIKALEDEQTMGYQNPEYFINEAAEQAVALIDRIYHA